MPFIALCPHCRIAKVQAPKRKQGMLYTCPKCNTQFPLEPMTESSLPVDYKLPPMEYDIAEAYRDDPPDDFATARTMVSKPLGASTTATPSEVQPVMLPSVPPAIKQSTTIIQELDYTPNPTSLEPPMWLTLAAGGVFGLAMIITQFSYGRIIAIPLLLIGCLLGVFGRGNLEQVRKKYGVLAIGVNVLGLILVLLLPDWLRMGPWIPEGDPNAGPKPALSVPRDSSPPTPAEWVDLKTAYWRQDDVNVDVVSIRQELFDPKAKPESNRLPKHVLRFTLKISNFNVGRAVSVSGWTSEATPRLTLASGPPVPFLKVETPLPKDVLGGKDVEIVLVFDVSPVKSGTLALEIPGEGFGAPVPVNFRIPIEMIAKPEKTR